eukprot:TRINITY_DN4915_c0_g1_i1.p1 TRINITY_DN4915_c0_g1~~TRINITY_DN4915_c0_g1_i1.p1  ORF type:complete len:423 (+),score=75.94 TRINITY_DN4915_c0_g1_i1:25-1293(+)
MNDRQGPGEKRKQADDEATFRASSISEKSSVGGRQPLPSMQIGKRFHAEAIQSLAQFDTAEPALSNLALPSVKQLMASALSRSDRPPPQPPQHNFWPFERLPFPVPSSAFPSGALPAPSGNVGAPSAVLPSPFNMSRFQFHSAPVSSSAQNVFPLKPQTSFTMGMGASTGASSLPSGHNMLAPVSASSIRSSAQPSQQPQQRQSVNNPSTTAANTMSSVVTSHLQSSPVVQPVSGPLAQKLQLVLLEGPDAHVFSDAALPLRIKITTAEGAPIPPRTFPQRVSVSCAVEDMYQNVVAVCLKGRRQGQRLLSQEILSVTFDATNEAELRNIRVREVTANHGGMAFALVLRLSQFPQVAPVRTRLFYVRSKRMRAPSYQGQVARQRQRQLDRQKAVHEMSDEEDDAEADPAVDIAAAVVDGSVL